MLNWVKMLLAGGSYNSKNLLSSNSMQEIFGSHVIASSYAETTDALLAAYGLGWYIHPYRGHYSVSHDGTIDGFVSVVSLFPNDGFGIVVLTNKNMFSVPRYLSMEIVDQILGLPGRDWLQAARAAVENGKKAIQEDQTASDSARKKGTTPSHPIEDYVGLYEHPAYGTMKIELVDGNLISILHGIRSRLEHWHYDVFNLAEDLQDTLVNRQGIKFTFRTNTNGAIDEIAVPFELKTSDIIFKKKPKYANPDYYSPYIGEYEIYGISVYISLKGGILTAKIPGQSDYELEPLTDNEFNVKNDNYLVRFVLGDDGLASEVILVLPYGAYSADRVRE
jgi:hypothetical protein